MSAFGRPGDDAAEADTREHDRGYFLAERARILMRPALAQRDDVRLAADTGEHLEAVGLVYAHARRDGLATRTAVFLAIYSRAHMDGSVFRRTHAQIAEDVTVFAGHPVSENTVKKYMSEFHRKGLMVTLERGLSPAAHARCGGEGPRVPLYALVVPVELDGQLPDRTPLRKGRDAKARSAAEGARVRAILGLPEVETAGQRRWESSSTGQEQVVSSDPEPVDEDSHPNRGFSKKVVSPGPPVRRDRTRPGGAPLSRRGDSSTPRKTSPAGHIATELTGHLVLRRMSQSRLTRTVRPFANSGWSAHDVVWALEHHPDGTPHICTNRVERPVGWAAYRLGLWVATDGMPMPGRRQQLAKAAGRPVPPRSWEMPDPTPQTTAPDLSFAEPLPPDEGLALRAEMAARRTARANEPSGRRTWAEMWIASRSEGRDAR